MSVVKITLPLGEVPVTGKQVTFNAPCDCSGVEALQIDGVNYAVVDALGNTVTKNGKVGIWCSGAKVSVILDVEAQRAFLLNGGTLLPMSENRIREICT